MPGVLYKKGGGMVYPPDWSQIGYANTPISTLNGFDLAKDILDNWDTSYTTHTEKYRNNSFLMYFPANIDASNLQTCDRMFQGSNLEYIEIDLTATRTAASLFADCHNLRYAKITGAGSEANFVTLSNMFIECHALEEISFDFTHIQANTYLQNFCKNCYSLKSFEYDGSDITGYVINASGAFENCYDLDSLTFKDDNCKNLGCYAAGRDGNCTFDVDIGADTTGVEFSFDGNATISGDSVINLRNVSTAQNGFRYAIFHDGADINILGSDINCTALFKGARLLGDTSTIQVATVGNALQMFDAAEGYINRWETLSLTNINFGTCANFKNAFSALRYIKDIIFPTNDYIFESATNLQDCFYGSYSLSNNCVNDILDQLAHATAYTGTKTLAYLGFDSDHYPAATIQSLSNYTAFTAAGWSIGY